jgi:hypothetical protein
MKIVQATGQTCNQFWIYSNFISEAIEYNEQFAIWVPNVNFEYYPDLLNCSLIKYPLVIKKIAHKIGINKYFRYIHTIFNNKYSVKIFQYFISKFTKHQFIIADVGTYMSGFKFKHQDLILKYFEPSTFIKYNGNSILKNIKCDLLIGVHIRRGDYKNFKNGVYYYPDEFYVQILNKLVSIFNKKKITFLIVSNEKIDLQTFSEFDIVTSNGKFMSEDLYLLSKTNYIIGPPSTFSAWASLKNSIPISFINKNQLESLSLSNFIDIRDIWF